MDKKTEYLEYLRFNISGLKKNKIEGDEETYDRLLGYCECILDVEPNNTEVKNYEKYITDAKSKIRSTGNESSINDEEEDEDALIEDSSKHHSHQDIKDTRKYDGWLVSDSFLKRAFAVWGHYFVATLIMGLICFILIMLLGISFIGLLTRLITR